MNNHRSHHQRAKGFTLLEVLMVILLIAVLLGAATPAINGSMTGTRLKEASTLLYNRILEAQQLAITLGTDTEVRFYQVPDLIDQTSRPLLRKVQVFALEPAPDGADAQNTSLSFSPVGAADSLPSSMVISERSMFTSIRTLGYQTDPARTSQGHFIAFRFHADGSTNLPTNKAWFLTVVEKLPVESEQRPKNFVTLQIDPVSGRIRTFQPG